MFQKKLAGVLPKNQPIQTAAYQDKEPERRKKVEIEEAHDGTFTIRCYGGPKTTWDGKLLTARTWKEASRKGAEHMNAGEPAQTQGEKE